MNNGNSPKRAFVVSWSAFLLLKLVLFFKYGPLQFLDTGHYVDLARLISLDFFLQKVNLASGVLCLPVFRPIGYPALLSLFMAVLPNLWAYGVVIAQIGLSLIASMSLVRLGVVFGLTPRAIFGLMVVHLFGRILVYDQSLLTDSLAANLWLICFSLVGCRIARSEVLSAADLIRCGLLLSATLLLRSFTVFLAIPFVLLAAAWNGLVTHRFFRFIVSALLIAAPLLLTHETYSAWNRFRTGRSFITTEAQSVVVLGLWEAREAGLPIFNQDTAWDRAGQATVEGDRFVAMWKFNEELFNRYGWNSLKIARTNVRRYLQLYRKHPITMAKVAIERFNLRPMVLGFLPARTLMEIRWTSIHGPVRNPGGRPRHPRSSWPLLDKILLYVAEIEVGIGLVLFLLFAAGPIILQLPAPGDTARLRGLMFCWVTYAGFTGVYLLVNMDPRYLLPVIPLSVLGAFLSAQRLVGRIKTAWAVWNSR